MIHELKTEKQFFDEVAAGNKPFEMRVFDRQFEVGDLLALNEVIPDPDPGPQLDDDEGPAVIYTGRCILVLVTYVLTDPRFVPTGTCAMGIRPVHLRVYTEDMDLWRREVYVCPVYDRGKLMAKGGRNDGDRA